MKLLAKTAAVISFLFCLTGGLWILFNVGIQHKEDALWTGIGLYFIGKAFFVGPMLFMVADQFGQSRVPDSISSR